MLHLIAHRFVPAPLHRLVLRYVHRVRVVWWRWAKTRTHDCRVIALDDEGRVLLVRHSYGDYGWLLPGGRPDRGESPIAAALRELREETGYGLTDAKLVITSAFAARHQHHVVAGRATGDVKIDGREIVEARFYTLDVLPAPISERLVKRLHQGIARYREPDA
jgi:8-oxo-dGTP pyrophosphatase MutT (NUDIX family)